MMIRLTAVLAYLGIFWQNVQGFVGPTCTARASSTHLAALTERQMQFWEDVEDGLKEIEDFYQSQGAGDIDRIWGFCQR